MPGTSFKRSNEYFSLQPFFKRRGGLKRNSPACLDVNDGAGLRIPSLSGFSSAHGEGTESRKLEPFFFFNRSANGFKCCIHRKLCGFLAKLSYLSKLRETHFRFYS